MEVTNKTTFYIVNKILQMVHLGLRALEGAMAYRTTMRTPTRKTLFAMTYSSEARILMEIGMASHLV